MYRNLLFKQPVDIPVTSIFINPLGELYQAIPFDLFIEHISKPKRTISGKGCKPWFEVKRGIALQILKSYYRCSDALLTDKWQRQAQMFCGIFVVA